MVNRLHRVCWNVEVRHSQANRGAARRVVSWRRCRVPGMWSDDRAYGRGVGLCAFSKGCLRVGSPSSYEWLGMPQPVLDGGTHGVIAILPKPYTRRCASATTTSPPRSSCKRRRRHYEMKTS